MEINNKKYLNQGIHVITSIFTVDNGVTKVLLIKRNNNPFKDMWALVGGALYNDEEVDGGAKREILEKTGIKNINLIFDSVFSKVNRSPLMRMIAVSYIGVLDKDKVNILTETLKTSNADWFPIDSIPTLAYDHNEILNKALEKLKEEVVNSNILQALFPNGFTIPEVQKTYESILNKEFDRRNFRRKLLSLDLIYDTNKEITFQGNKKAKLYKFKNNKDENKNVLL